MTEHVKVSLFRKEQVTMTVKIERCVKLFLLVGAVGAHAQLSQRASMSTAPSIAAAHDSEPTLLQHYPRYTIKRQDTLLISFPLTPDLNKTAIVQPDGYINLNGAPSVHVEGLTVPEVEAALQTTYAVTLNEPIIHVDLKDFQKPFFTVNGQVGKPGQYDLRSDITVAEAIAVAGGLQTTANNEIYFLQRTPSNVYKVTKLNAKKLLTGSEQADNVIVRPGDMIMVPESGINIFKKYVPYSIGGFINPVP
jgi:polysaccharide export outer membrane protein